MARVILCALSLMAAICSVAMADPTPAPYGWRANLDGFASLLDQATDGSGTQPPEGPGFAAGAPLSPMTPYDTFASIPNTPGVAGIAQFMLTTQYAGKRIDASLEPGIGYVNGSITNAAYWTESLMPTLNPHLGSQALGYSVAFPTHAGQDDARTVRASIFSGSIGAHDGSWLVRGGWFELEQSDRFVFVQPQFPNLTPALGVQTAESLGNGSPVLDGWLNSAPGLPLHGVDLVAHRRSATLELSDAALPSSPGEAARLSLGSIVLDRGSGTRFSAELLHVFTGGDIQSVTALFGADPTLDAGPQGLLPTSNLGGQRETIAGLRAAFHATRALDAALEIGRAWYDADHVFAPGTAKPGGYYHAALSRSIGRITAAVEGYRFEPRYATVILPYGVPENVWSAAWAWPGIWLKSTYQLADNTVAGTNRQGFRLRYALDGGPLEVHAAYSTFQQIETSSTDNGHQVGFVEGFFLPQQPDAATLGRQHQYAAWIAWHPKVADLALDYVDDTMHRDASLGHPEDAVTYAAPQVVITLSRSLSKSAIAAIGFGRYAMRGSWAHGSPTNVDYGQNVAFAGTQLAESKNVMLLLQVRRTVFSGLPSVPGGLSPDYRGTMLIFEQRFHVET